MTVNNFKFLNHKIKWFKKNSQLVLFKLNSWMKFKNHQIIELHMHKKMTITSYKNFQLMKLSYWLMKRNKLKSRFQIKDLLTQQMKCGVMKVIKKSKINLNKRVIKLMNLMILKICLKSLNKFRKTSRLIKMKFFEALTWKAV
jgi:hypothetical protein